jgi:branched-chain amino acid transport system permease protein
MTKEFDFGGVLVPGVRLATLAIALSLAAGFYLFLNKTRVGTGLRCCNVDRDTATLMGINVPAMQTLAFAVGSGLAGAGGALISMSHAFNPYFGSLIVVKGFVIALAGGLGNVAGAFWMAILFGVAEAMTVYGGLSEYSNALPFACIIVLLLIRPTGLFAGSHGSAIT